MDDVDKIVYLVVNYYKELKPFLNYRNSYEQLIMVILTAQTTDAQVNKIAPLLFEKYPSFKDLANADVREVEALIYSTGFYKTKAKNIINCAKQITEKFSGRLPSSMKDFLTLAGVGRKTANVILGSHYALPVIIVDTHFKRVARRTGLTQSLNPAKIERELKFKIDSKKQYEFSMKANKLGRDFCHARKPNCQECFLRELCPKLI